MRNNFGALKGKGIRYGKHFKFTIVQIGENQFRIKVKNWYKIEAERLIDLLFLFIKSKPYNIFSIYPKCQLIVIIFFSKEDLTALVIRKLEI